MLTEAIRTSMPEIVVIVIMLVCVIFCPRGV